MGRARVAFAADLAAKQLEFEEELVRIKTSADADLAKAKDRFNALLAERQRAEPRLDTIDDAAPLAAASIGCVRLA